MAITFNHNDKLYVNGSNVGIGTSTPEWLLQLHEPTGGANYIKITNQNTTEDGGNGMLIGISASEQATIWNYENTNMRFATNGTERVTITNTGNVGIGTTSPSGILHSYISATRQMGHNAIGGDLGVISDNNSAPVLYVKGTGTADLVNVFDNTTNVFTIKDGGNVGIGTTSPSEKLEVIGNIKAGAGAADNSVQARHSDNSYTSVHGYGLYMSRASSYIRPTVDNTQALYIGTDSKQWSTISVDASTTAFSTNGSEAMRITSAGNVGIGTTGPSEKLHVNEGNIRLEASTDGGNGILRLYDSSNTESGQIYPHSGDLRIYSANDVLFNNAGNVGIGTTSPVAKLHIQGTNSTNGGIRLHNASGNPYSIWSDNNNFYISQGNGSTTAISVTYAGNVGIGTTSPASKLHVYASDSGATAYQSGNDGLTIERGGRVAINLLSPTASDSYVFFGNPTAGNAAYLGYQNTENRLVLKSSDYISLLDSTGEVVRVDGGRVGIGTTAPSSILHVETADTVKTAVHISNTSTGGKKWDIASIGSSVTGRVGNLQIRNETDSANYVEITHDGNVGIGTTSPAQKLHVEGSVLIDAFNAGNETGIFFRESFYNYNVSILAYDHNGDGTTPDGISINGYDGVSFSTGANTRNERMRITQSGNVGIGTTSPGAKLHVSSGHILLDNAYNLQWKDFGGGVRSQIWLDSSNRFLITAAGNGQHLHFGDGTSATSDTWFATDTESNYTNLSLMLKADGKVGIGTTSPLRKLHVAGNTSDVTVRVDTTGADPSITLTTLGQQDWGIGVDYSDGGKLKFDTSTTVGANTKVAIDGSGNVGIGTTSPSEKLEVNGTLAINHPSPTLVLRDSTDDDDHYIQFKNNGDSVYYQIDTAGDTWNFNSLLARSIKFGTAGSDRLVISGAGNVGIGTTSPSYKLHVAGAVMTEGINVFKNATGGVINTFENYTGYVLNRVYADYANDGAVVEFQERIGVDGNYTRIGNYSNHPLYLMTNNSTNLTLLTNGNVGIGTTSPAAKLDVNGVVSLKTGSDSAYSIGVLEITSGGTPTQIKITTAIPFGGTTNAHSVTIKGFQYGSANTANLQISWHVYNNSFYSRTATSSGGWAPTIRLAVENGYVVIHLTSPGYWPKLYVESLYNAYGGTSHAQGWSWADAAINSDTNTPNEVVPYKVDFGNSFAMTSSGNVGIGTTSPSTKLHIDGGSVKVTGNATDQYFLEGVRTGVGTTIRIYDNANTAYIDSYNNMAFRANQNGGSGGTFRFTGGNVGIGTTSPQAKLEVDGSANSFVAHFGQGQDNGDGAWGGISIGYGETSNSLYRKVGIVAEAHADGAARQHLHFLVDTVPDSNSATLSDSKMMIDGFSGNVGIGTTSPSYKLQVSEADYARISLHQTTTGALWQWGNDGSNMYAYYTNTGVRALDINQAGNVGIGTTSPSSKLHINTEDNPTTLSITRGGTNLSASTSIGVVSFDADYSGSPTNYGYISLGSNNISGVRGSMNLAVKSTSGNVISGMTLYGTNAGVNVGIGNSTPGYKLEVEGAISAGTANSTNGSLILVGKYNNGNIITIGGGYGGGGAVIGYGVKPSTTAAGAFLSSSALANLERSAYVQYGSTHQWWTGAYQTVAVDSAATLSQVMTLDGAGNLGIGTTSPARKLHIVDSVWDNSNGGGVIFENSNTVGASLTLKPSASVVTNGANGWALYAGGPGAAIGDGNLGFWAHATNDARMVIQRGGNVGIGTTSPQYKLTVSSGTADIGILTASSDSGSYVGFLDNATSTIPKVGAVGNKLILDASQYVGVRRTDPSYALDVSGTIRATGDVIAYSDARVKENVETIPNALEKVKAMRGVGYNKIGEQKRSIGVIAQEMLEVMPEVVSQDEQGMYSVAYGNLVGVLVEAMKEQQKQIDELKAQLDGITK